MTASSAAGCEGPALQHRQQGSFSLQPVDTAAAVEQRSANGNGGLESRSPRSAAPDDSREAGPLRSLHVEHVQQRWEGHSAASPGSCGADAKAGRWAELASGCPGASAVLGAFSDLDSRLGVVCAYSAVLAISQSSLRATLPSYVEVGTPAPPRAVQSGMMGSIQCFQNCLCHSDRSAIASGPTSLHCHCLVNVKIYHTNHTRQ